jgi:hypothetical protein
MQTVEEKIARHKAEESAGVRYVSGPFMLLSVLRKLYITILCMVEWVVVNAF